MKNITRREVLKDLAIGRAAATLPLKFGLSYAYAAAINSPNLRKFIQSLRGLGAGGIPVAASDGTGIGGATHYTIEIKQFKDQLHPDIGRFRLRCGDSIRQGTLHPHISAA